ncbi:MAG: hypothetical protein IJF92_03945 [Bacilli bacterium]|nr:hypothetical protein [Bacilli bacterium]
MKDYRNKYERKGKNDYVLGYEVCDSNDSIVVHYAPTKEDKYLFNEGIKFSIPNTEENLNNLKFKMHKQMGQGIAEKAKYKLKRNASALLTATCAIGTAISTQVNDRTVAIASVATIAGMVYFGIKTKRNSKKIEEIEKAEICRAYAYEFKHLDKYPNALVGANKEFIKQIESDSKFLITADGKYIYPTINNFDKFLIEDVKKLKYNIDLEKTIEDSKSKKLVIAK